MQDRIGKLLEETATQPKVLDAFLKTRIPRASAGAIFVGAGDSYAAALATSYFSRGRYLSCDPYALAATPEMAEGKQVYFISVSGRTSSNISAAKLVRNTAKNTIAFTADTESPLALATKETVELPMKYVPKSPGLLSFSISLLGSLMASAEKLTCNFGKVWEAASKDCREVMHRPGVNYFLGNSIAYPISIYYAAKMQEILGAKAHSVLLEEFSHTHLLSLSKSDSVSILLFLDPFNIGKKLESALKGQGYESTVIELKGSTELEKIFYGVFVSQLSVLIAAKRRGIVTPRFLTAKQKLRISDQMIY